MRLTRPLLAALVALVTTAAMARALHAQAEPRPRWTLGGTTEVLRASRDAWGVGPSLGIRRDFGPRWGVELRAALPAFGGDAGGAAIDLAATWVHFAGVTELGASLGGTGFLVGDNSELIGGGVGVYAAVHATRWLTRGFGLTAGASLRTAIGGYPGAYAGLALRF
jgi:hypothetical protein